MYRLSTREPFVTSPAAALGALRPSSYDAELDRIHWFPPRDFSAAGFFGGMSFLFFDPPERRMLLTLTVGARAHDGMTGHVLISSFYTEGRAQFPIADNFAVHTFDVVFAPFAGRRLGIIVTIQEGIAHLAFVSATLQDEPPVIDPGINMLSARSLQLAYGASDRAQVRHAHLLVLARHDNAGSAGLERLDRRLVDLVGIAGHVSLPHGTSKPMPV